MPSFFAHISYIIFLRSYKQMRGIAANGIVAFVQNIEIYWNWTDKVLVRKSMCFYPNSSFYNNLSINAIRRRTPPTPTSEIVFYNVRGIIAQNRTKFGAGSSRFKFFPAGMANAQ